MQRLAIIGSGITGLSAAQLLKHRYDITVFEKASRPGGLIKCERINDSLFHRVGGHVFNSRNQEVLDWFWGFFDRDKEFIKAKRNAKILLNGKFVGYPLENHLSKLDKETVAQILKEQLDLYCQAGTKKPEDYPHFEAFLIGNFGPTLYNLYFKPYNTKIWNTDLSRVPLAWLEGKLPMPNVPQMLLANIATQEESDMVHATFYYAKENGSQFIVNRLSEGLNIQCDMPIDSILFTGEQVYVNGHSFDKVIFTGDVRQLGTIITHESDELKRALMGIENLPSNGTSNVFCETDPTDLSWLYLPDADIKAHRIIYTGTFAESNNRGSERQTCVVEFSGKHSVEDIEVEITKLPGNLRIMDYNYEPNSYVVQEPSTRQKIDDIKRLTEPYNFYLAGRFAEWEYHNMDKAIEASMAIANRI